MYRTVLQLGRSVLPVSASEWATAVEVTLSSDVAHEPRVPIFVACGDKTIAAALLRGHEVRSCLVEPFLPLEQPAKEHVVLGAMPKAHRSARVVDRLAREASSRIHSGAVAKQGITVAVELDAVVEKLLTHRGFVIDPGSIGAFLSASCIRAASGWMAILSSIHCCLA